MPKNDNAHSLRLAESLRRHIGPEDALDFEAALPLSKSADAHKKFNWAVSVCTYLEERFDPETILRIRKDCRCNDGKSIADKIALYMKKADSLRQLTEDFNTHETFASLQYLSDRHLRLCYPQCYCACIKRAPGEVTRTWCACTLGNAEAIFQCVLCQPVRATLVESIKTGGSQCVIDIQW